MADYHIVGRILQEAEGYGIPEGEDPSKAGCGGRSRITTWFSSHTFRAKMSFG
jgi:hypothetical protein